MQFYLALLLLGHILQIKGENMVEKEEKKTMLYTVKSLANQDHESHVATVTSNDTALNDDERGFAIPLMMDPRLIYWAARGVDPHSMFKEKFFDKSFPSLLEDLKFKTWVRYLIYLRKKHPEKPVYAIDILTNKHGVVPLTEMIEKALVGTNSAQKELGKILASEQQYLWRMRNEQDVFTILQLDKAGDDLLKTPGLLTWYNYEMSSSAKDIAEIKVCRQLASRYSGDALAEMFGAAKPNYEASELIVSSLRSLVAKRSVDISLIQFLDGHRNSNLEDVIREADLLTILLKTGSSYRTSQDLLAVDLLVQNHGEAALASKLWPAYLERETNQVASRLLRAQFWRWTHFEYTQIFKLLGLGGDIDKVLTHPNLIIFNYYMHVLMMENRIERYSPINSFIDVFGEVPTARMLEAAKKSESVINYQVGLFKKWQTQSLKDIKARFAGDPARIDKDLFERYEAYLNSQTAKPQ
ncbi:hypothetical protein Plhal304r1_c003g0011251 [Plasmopara halstedii]